MPVKYEISMKFSSENHSVKTFKEFHFPQVSSPGNFKMSRLEVLIVVIFLTSEALSEGGPQLDCSVLSFNDEKMCVNFDLQSFTNPTVIEGTDVLEPWLITRVYLASETMFHLPKNVFSFFPNVTDIGIFTAHPQLTSLQSSVFDGLTRLRKIFIAGQQIKVLQPNSFEGATNVRFLPFNRIESIDEMAFNGLTKCTFLILSHNRIKTLGANTFVHMPLLWSVNLESNQLQALNENHFAIHERLAIVDLSFNRIKFLPVNIVENFIASNDTKKVLSLKGNLCNDQSYTIKDVIDGDGGNVMKSLSKCLISHSNGAGEDEDGNGVESLSVSDISSDSTAQNNLLEENEKLRIEIDGLRNTNNCSIIRKVDGTSNEIEKLDEFNEPGEDRLTQCAKETENLLVKLSVLVSENDRLREISLTGNLTADQIDLIFKEGDKLSSEQSKEAGRNQIEVEKLMIQIEKLQEENEKLRKAEGCELTEALVNVTETISTEDGLVNVTQSTEDTTIEESRDQNEQLKLEIENLRAENEQLRETGNSSSSCSGGEFDGKTEKLLIQIAELEAEIEQIREFKGCEFGNSTIPEMSMNLSGANDGTNKTDDHDYENFESQIGDQEIVHKLESFNETQIMEENEKLHTEVAQLKAENERLKLANENSEEVRQDSEESGYKQEIDVTIGQSKDQEIHSSALEVPCTTETRDEEFEQLEKSCRNRTLECQETTRVLKNRVELAKTWYRTWHNQKPLVCKESVEIQQLSEMVTSLNKELAKKDILLAETGAVTEGNEFQEVRETTVDEGNSMVSKVEHLQNQVDELMKENEEKKKLQAQLLLDNQRLTEEVHNLSSYSSCSKEDQRELIKHLLPQIHHWKQQNEELQEALKELGKNNQSCDAFPPTHSSPSFLADKECSNIDIEEDLMASIEIMKDLRAKNQILSSHVERLLTIVKERFASSKEEQNPQLVLSSNEKTPCFEDENNSKTIECGNELVSCREKLSSAVSWYEIWHENEPIVCNETAEVQQ